MEKMTIPIIRRKFSVQPHLIRRKASTRIRVISQGENSSRNEK